MIFPHWLKSVGKKLGDAVSTIAVAVALTYAYAHATAAWGALPTVGSGSGLTSAGWNDLVDQANTLAGAFAVSSGNATMGAGKVLSAGKLRPVDVVTPGTACSPNGLIAQDSVGAVLSCQSGVWKWSGGVDVIYVQVNTWSSTSASCPADHPVLIGVLPYMLNWGRWWAYSSIVPTGNGGYNVLGSGADQVNAYIACSK